MILGEFREMTKDLSDDTEMLMDDGEDGFNQVCPTDSQVISLKLGEDGEDEEPVICLFPCYHDEETDIFGNEISQN